MLKPPRLCPGDPVSIIAPSGPVPRDRFEAGAKILGARYRLVYDERIFERVGFLAGRDEARLAELAAALADPGTRAVFCARGGYGLTRLLDRLAPVLKGAREKPVVGFSDITALHAARLRGGASTIHGPVLTQLGELDVTDVEALYSLLETPTAPPPFEDLDILVPGAAEGPIVGGNLEVLSRLVGTPYLPDLKGAVLFLEEVGERPYRIDRQLTHLLSAGALAGVRGVLLGDFHLCDEPDGPRALEVILERLHALKIPVLAGLPAGHGARNRAFALGTQVRVQALGEGRVEFLEAAVT